MDSYMCTSSTPPPPGHGGAVNPRLMAAPRTPTRSSRLSSPPKWDVPKTPKKSKTAPAQWLVSENPSTPKRWQLPTPPRRPQRPVARALKVGTTYLPTPASPSPSRISAPLLRPRRLSDPASTRPAVPPSPTVLHASNRLSRMAKLPNRSPLPSPGGLLGSPFRPT